MKTRVLLTGFEPFDGRSHNASWVAAQAGQSLSADFELKILCLPVLWSEPGRILQQTVNEWSPQIVIALGEGMPGRITLESLARNQRLRRADNSGCFPFAPIDVGGPKTVKSSADLNRLQTQLQARHIKTIISTDAGGFLCEETLYVLESIRLSQPQIGMVLFVHLPPYGTELIFKGKLRQCDKSLLIEFSSDLLFTVISTAATVL